MLKKIRRAAAMVVVLIFTLALMPQIAGASEDLVLLCINDEIITGISSSSMPVRINNNTYIAVKYLLRIKPLKYFYDEDIHILKVYSSGVSIIFDIKNGITYDQEGKIYSYLAEERNGGIFVPIEFICRVFGYAYSQIQSDYGNVIRINSIASQYTDSQLMEVRRSQMKEIYDSYYWTSAEDLGQAVKPPSESSIPDAPQDEGEGSEDVSGSAKNVYIAICGEINSYTSDILDQLDRYGLKAAFFVSEKGLEQQGELLRRIVCEGHSLGVYASSGEPYEEAERINGILSSFVFRKTRLLMFASGSRNTAISDRSEVTEGGYRIWDMMLDPGSSWSTGYSVRNSGIRLLNSVSGRTVLGLYSTEAGAYASSGLFSTLSGSGYSVNLMREWTTPINGIYNYS